MKLHEILEQAKPGDWFRPSWYDGSGMAYANMGGMLAIVPSLHGAEITNVSVDALKSDWVFVLPDVVIAERQKWPR